MPRTAIISDIHANMHALSSVVEDAQTLQCDEIVCLGDIVGYNAYPRECVDYIRSLNGFVVRGNHDEEVVLENYANMNPVAKQAMEWTRRQLDDEQIEWLAKLPYMKLVRSTFSMVHATLDQPKSWGYIINANDASAHFNKQFSSLCFHGHTHVPKIFFWDGIGAQEDTEALTHLAEDGFVDFSPRANVKYFINVGSVGQPRDKDSRASYAIFDSETRIISFRRVSYDIASAQQAIHHAGLPAFLADRLAQGI